MFDPREEQWIREAFAARHRALADALPDEAAALSAGAERKMLRLMSRQKKIYYPLINTGLKRVACLLVAVLLIGAGATVGVSSLQRKAPGFTVYTYESGTAIGFGYRATPFVAKRPAYLPAGYTLLWDRSDETETYLFYEGAGGGFFCFAQYPSGDRATHSIGTQEYEEVLIAERYEGIYIQNGEYTCLIFTEGDFMYLINGTLPQEELFAVAASVFES